MLRPLPHQIEALIAVVTLIGAFTVTWAALVVARQIAGMRDDLKEHLGSIKIVLEKQAAQGVGSAGAHHPQGHTGGVVAAQQLTPAAVRGAARVVPEVAPEDIAPGLMRPPKPAGGFGSPGVD